MFVMTLYQVSDIPDAMKSLEQVVSDTSDPLDLHVPGTSEVSPKLQLPKKDLVQYLQEKHRLSDNDEELVIRQFSHGQSNPTYYVAYGGQEMVLRKKPVSPNSIILHKDTAVYFCHLARQTAAFSSCSREGVSCDGSSWKTQCSCSRTYVTL